jgi:hypothetical protein
MTDAASLSTLTRSQREGFIDTLEGLPPEQWLGPSLCSEWRAIDVAAHLAWAPVLGAGAGAVAMVRHGFSMNRMIARSAIAWSRAARLRSSSSSGTTRAGAPPYRHAARGRTRGRRGARARRTPRARASGSGAGGVVGSPVRLHAGHAVADERRRRQLPSPGRHRHGLVPRRRPRRRGTAEALLLLLYGRLPRTDELTDEGAPTILARL